MELACQARKCPVTFGLRTVTGGAWRNLGIWNAVLVDLLSSRHEFPWGPPNGLGSRSLKCVATAVSIEGLSAWATLNMTGFVRLRSMKARN